MKPMKPFAQAKQFSSNQIIFGSILLLTLYSAVAVTVSLFRGSDAKIAYVNSAILLQKYKGAIDANKRFEEESKTWETNIRTLQSELDSLNFLFTKESEHWSLNKKKEVATYARKKEQDLNRYSQAIQQKASAR
ncbi:OmpH family outer membrane protein, partial [bacterium]|nr:OmpH family outer membrane protein [bacterium]